MKLSKEPEMTKRLAICLLAALLAATAGCSGGSDELEGDAGDNGASTQMPVDTPSAPNPSELLTPSDVEAVSGLTGLEVVPYEPAVGAGGDVNIADASGQLVAMLVVDSLETWDAWLTDGFTVSEPVNPPVGDEAFIGPSPDVSGVIYIFGFRKGDVAVVIDTYFDVGATGTILSVEQLRELAEIVEGRL
jgi:hypothetical protein